jgi:hypothetical protein
MTNGVIDGTCLGYNIVEGNSQFNITNTSIATNQTCQISDVVCSYTYDEATANEQSFYDDNTSTTFSAFTLLGVIAVVLAAVIVAGLVALFKT